MGSVAIVREPSLSRSVVCLLKSHWVLYSPVLGRRAQRTGHTSTSTTHTHSRLWIRRPRLDRVCQRKERRYESGLFARGLQRTSKCSLQPVPGSDTLLWFCMEHKRHNTRHAAARAAAANETSPFSSPSCSPPRTNSPEGTSPKSDMYEAFQAWALKTYGDSAKTKTVTRRKYNRIFKILEGEEHSSSENSKFRFWVKAKGFRIGPPHGHPHFSIKSNSQVLYIPVTKIPVSTLFSYYHHFLHFCTSLGRLHPNLNLTTEKRVKSHLNFIIFMFL